MGDIEDQSRFAPTYGVAGTTLVSGNAADATTPVDRLPNPLNPFAVDDGGMDGLDRMLTCVAASAATLRDAGYPEKTAFELVMAAKHIKSCMNEVDKIRLSGEVIQAPNSTTKMHWSHEFRESRCCKMVKKGRHHVEA